MYTTLEAQGLTVSGGRIDGVGVGGYLLGGGYSYLSDEVSASPMHQSSNQSSLLRSSKSGLSMDNVNSFEVVLPNATVATASATVNPDLFWGLKGGFNNFGDDLPNPHQGNARMLMLALPLRYRHLGKCQGFPPRPGLCTSC